MPIQKCKLPNDGDGWQWGDSGKCYAERADAEKQAAAAHANGYTGDAEFNESDHPRAPDGEFTEGGGSSGATGKPSTKPAGEKRKFSPGGTHENRMHELSSRRLDEEIEKAGAIHSKINTQMIDAGRGSERAQETMKKASAGGDPLANEFKRTFEEVNALYEHRSERSRLGENYVRNRGQRELEEKKFQASAHDEFIALDRASVRTIDQDGHLHVSESNISMAAVNPYIGREIPDWQELGLEPDKVYQLFRDPLELSKAANTFDGKPLLFRHKPTDSRDHATDLVVGAVYNTTFDAPFLKAELVVWPGKAIDAIETGAKQELSCGYRYKANMTPGVYNGKAYDGIMTEIEGNHVALVEEGRAGPHVVVGDSNGEIIMAKTVLSRKAAVAQGALLVYLRPKLAQDAKIDLTPILEKITKDNFKDSKPSIITALKERTKGKLAQDAALDDAGSLLDSIEALNIAEDEESDKDKKAKGEDEWPDKDDDDDKKDKAKDKKKSAKDADPDDEDDDDEEEKKKKRMEAKDKWPKKGAKDEDPDDDNVKKPAMDEAIAAAVKVATAAAIKTQQGIRDAERAVRPYVGDLAMAHDSAGAVYRTALDALGIKTEGINELVALKTILEMQPKPSDSKTKQPRVAMDAAGAKSFNEMFPDAARIRLM